MNNGTNERFFELTAEKIDSLMTPTFVGKEKRYYVVDPIIFNADKMMEIINQVTYMEELSKVVNKKDERVKNGLRIFTRAFHKR